MAEPRPNVLVFNHFAAPRGEAGGTRHVELFGRIEGWDHLVIASDLNPQTGRRVGPEPGFAVVRVPEYTTNGGRRVLNWAAYAARATVLGLRQRRVDVVYGSSPHLLAPLGAWVVSVVRRAPFVLEIRDLWPQVLVDMGTLRESSKAYAVLRRLEELLYARAKAIVVMAEGSRTALVARGIAPSKIHYIPNGPDPAEFVPSADRDSLRAQWGFSRFTALYTGAHGPANCLDLLLDAAAEVGDLDVDVVLVGGGVEKQRLVDRVAGEGIVNVRFLDPIPKSDIPDILAAADLGLHVLADVELFRSAVSPNKVFDYMAAGLPVLTNCPGIVSDLIESTGAGWTCPPAGLGEALRAAAEASSDQRAAAGALGREWLVANQSRSAMAGRLSKVLDGLR